MAASNIANQLSNSMNNAEIQPSINSSLIHPRVHHSHSMFSTVNPYSIPSLLPHHTHPYSAYSLNPYYPHHPLPPPPIPYGSTITHLPHAPMAPAHPNHRYPIPYMSDIAQTSLTTHMPAASIASQPSSSQIAQPSSVTTAATSTSTSKCNKQSSTTKNDIKSSVKHGKNSSNNSHKDNINSSSNNNTKMSNDSSRRRRTRCKKCESCLRADCGDCHFCKDMKKFGGPGRMKQSCIARQCLAPVLPHTACCYICGRDGWEKLTVDPSSLADETASSLMECSQCWEIVHPYCLNERQPDLFENEIKGLINKELPNSWECPKCIRLGVNNSNKQHQHETTSTSASSLTTINKCSSSYKTNSSKMCSAFIESSDDKSKKKSLIKQRSKSKDSAEINCGKSDGKNFAQQTRQNEKKFQAKSSSATSNSTSIPTNTDEEMNNSAHPTSLASAVVMVPIPPPPSQPLNPYLTYSHPHPYGSSMMPPATPSELHAHSNVCHQSSPSAHGGEYPTILPSYSNNPYPVPSNMLNNFHPIIPGSYDHHHHLTICHRDLHRQSIECYERPGITAPVEYKEPSHLAVEGCLPQQLCSVLQQSQNTAQSSHPLSEQSSTFISNSDLIEHDTFDSNQQKAKVENCSEIAEQEPTVVENSEETNLTNNNNESNVTKEDNHAQHQQNGSINDDDNKNSKKRRELKNPILVVRPIPLAEDIDESESDDSDNDNCSRIEIYNKKINELTKKLRKRISLNENLIENDRNVVLPILQHLDRNDILKCMTVSKNWYKWCLDCSLWSEIIIPSNQTINSTILIGIVRRQPRSLDLSWTNINVQQLSWLLSRLPQLQTLKLAGCRSKIVNSLQTCNIALLTGLDLSWSESFCDKFARHLFSKPIDSKPGQLDTQTRLRFLTYLNLSGTLITDETIEYMNEFLLMLDKVCLNECNLITDFGIRSLIESKSEKLVELHLNGCVRLTDISLQLIHLKCKQLSLLDIRNCHLVTKECCEQFLNSNYQSIIDDDHNCNISIPNHSLNHIIKDTANNSKLQSQQSGENYWRILEEKLFIH